MILTSNRRKLTDDLYCLGPEQMPGFLLDGNAPAMFEAGMSVFGAYYIEEIKNLLGARPLEYLFLTHMHFDHCGAAGHLKREFPDLTICASAAASAIIEKPSALETIKMLNCVPGMEDSQIFIPFKIDRILEDGEIVVLPGGVTVQAIAVPGHTRDLTAYYLPNNKVLMPSEAVGAPVAGGYILSEFLVDYESYLESLDILSKIDADMLIMGHKNIFTGKDARDHFPRALEQTVLFKGRIAALIRKNNADFVKVVETIKKEEYDQLPEPKLPEAAYMLNLNAKVRTVAKLVADEF